ncbi:MAG: hypothetical protein ABW277_25780 [Longimicrobiaceae bacterium]
MAAPLARASLLERAWELQRRSDMAGIVDLLADVSRAELTAEPELGLMLGFGWFHAGQWERALDIVQALYESLRGGDSRLARRVLNLHAMVLLNQGSLPEAEELWTELQERSVRESDPVTLAWASANLAAVADVQCRWEDALASSQRACAVQQQLGDRRALGGTHHNLGMTYRQLGFLHDADRSFERAAEYFRDHGSEDEIALTEMERGLTLYMLGDHRLAAASVGRALERFTRLGHVVGQCDCWRVLAIFALRERRLDQARRLLQPALERIREAVDRLTEAEILEELAVLEKLEGNAGESARRAAEAGSIYRGMGAVRRADRMEERLRAAAPGSGPTPGAG